MIKKAALCPAKLPLDIPSYIFILVWISGFLKISNTSGDPINVREKPNKISSIVKKAWEDEYQANIKIIRWSKSIALNDNPQDLDDWDLPNDLADQLEMMEPAERQQVLAELSSGSDFWDEDSEMLYE